MKKLLLICFIFLGCKNNQKIFGGVDFSSDDFKIVSPNHRWINLKSAKAPIKCLEIVDNELIAIDDANSLFAFNRASGITSTVARESSTSDDFIAPQQIFTLSPSTFVVYDLTSDVFFEYINTRIGWAKNKTFHLEEPLHGIPSISSLPKNQFLASSINNIQGKLIISNMYPKPSIQRYIGTIHKNEAENKYVTGMVNRSTAIYDKWSKKIYLGNFYSDVIESYDLNGKLEFKIKGPDNFEPVYKVKMVRNEQIFVNLPKTRSAFLSLTSDRDYIYVLYSGKEYDKPITNNGKTIYIFDKKGKPVKKINLTSDIGAIKADDNSHSLYCYYIDSNSNKQILVYDMR